MKFKSVFLAVVCAVATLSCSSDDDSRTATNAKITVTDANGPVENIVVYVYDETQWEVIGDDPLFAQGQASTDNNGVAKFSNLEYPTVFNQLNNNQNTMRFSVHYNMNGVSKTKVTAITFNKGDSKTGTLHLN